MVSISKRLSSSDFCYRMGNIRSCSSKVKGRLKRKLQSSSWLLGVPLCLLLWLVGRCVSILQQCNTHHSLTYNIASYVCLWTPSNSAISLKTMAEERKDDDDSIIITNKLLPHPMMTIYRNVHFFYPFGNIPPTYLLQHVPATQSKAHCLLLGCGDLRDLFFTLVCEDR